METEVNGQHRGFLQALGAPDTSYVFSNSTATNTEISLTIVLFSYSKEGGLEKQSAGGSEEGLQQTAAVILEKR